MANIRGVAVMIKISIDENKCMGCSYCVDACPEGVLDIVDGFSKVVNPQNCQACRSCEIVCLHEAIKVEELE